MAVNSKAIKTRIKSVGNTKKITKAMEMISAVKMRKAVESALNTRVYAKLAQDLLTHLSHLEEPNEPLLNVRPVKNILLILVSSNKGLCGSFNSNIFKKTLKLVKDDIKNLATHRLKNGEGKLKPEDNVKVDIMAVGKKSAYFAKKNDYELVSVFEKLSDKPSFEDITPISKQIIDEYKQKKYDKVIVSFTDYKSSIAQEPKVRQLLPLSEKDLEKMIDELGGVKESKEEVEEVDFQLENYIFEPGIDAIVEYVVPKLVEIQLYQAILESSASEHSARMVAMKSASDAANDMIKELNLTYNKARQASITQEIAEIAGGAAALE